MGLKALAALDEELSSVPSTHVLVHNHFITPVQGHLMSSSNLRENPTHTWHTYLPAGKTRKIK